MNAIAASVQSRSGAAALSRRSVALSRLDEARDALADCHLCSHNCGVNRLAGRIGLCHAGAEARIFSAQIEVSDELELIPVFAIALSGCDLRCDFCITGAASWNAHAGGQLSADRIAARARAALDAGARTIMILGGEPTIHLPTVLEIVGALPDEARLIWKTNAHGTAQAHALLDGLFDIWLADYKFGNDACAQRLAKVAAYTRVLQQNLLWASQRSELIVRHLLMPGHVECCWGPVAEWLAKELPSAKVNLRSGFWPAWHSSRHAEFRRPAFAAEVERALCIARQWSIKLIS